MARNKYLDWSGLSHYDVKIKEYITGKTNALDVRLSGAEQDIVNLKSNKANWATTLSGYNIADAYTKAEVDEKLSMKIQFKVVDSLPVSGETNVIYLVKSSTSVEGDVYDEYIWTNGKWEKIGSTKADLSMKVDKVTGATANDIAVFVAGGNIADSGKKVVESVRAAESADDNSLPTEKAIRTELDKKADIATTLAGYGITDAYTKSEVDVKDGNVLASAKTYAEEQDVILSGNVVAAINTEKSAREDADKALSGLVVAEESERKGAINSLSGDVVNAISAEETERKAQDAALSGLVYAEETERKAEDVKLSGMVYAEEVARKADKVALSGLVVAEEKARINAVTALTASLTAETKAREDAINALSGNVVNAISAETKAREDADIALSGLVVAEEKARINAVTALTASLTAETKAREDAITSLSGDVVNAVSAETIARKNADIALQANIDAEVSARTKADETLQANINNEATARTEADEALGRRIDALEAISGTSHTHGNKEELDKILAGDVAKWNAAEANAKGYASAYTDTKVNALSAATVAAIDAAKLEAEGAASAYTDNKVKALSGSVIAYADQKAAAAEANARGYASGYTDSQIKAAVESLDASVDNGDEQLVKVTVAEADGKLTGLTVDQSRLETAIANAGSGAVASAKTYTDAQISALSGVAHAEIEQAILTAEGAASAYTDSQIKALSGSVVAYADQKALAAETNAKGYASAYTDNKIAALDAAVTGVGSYIKVGVAEVDGKLTSVGIDETALDSEFELVASAISMEIADRKAAITSLSGDVVNAISAEETARKAQDAALSGLVYAEEVARKADKVALSGLVVTEAGLRKDADDALDARIDALEAISGQSHTHANKAELDKIQSGDKAKWDAAEGNAIASAKTYTDGQINTLSGNVVNAIATAKSEAIGAASAYTNAEIAKLDATVSGASNGFSVKVAEVDGKLSSIEVVGVDVDNKISTAIAGLDAEVSTSSDADVAITIVEVDGKLSGVTASIVSITNNEIDGLFV